MSVPDKFGEVVGVAGATGTGILGLVLGKIDIIQDVHSIFIACVIALITGFSGYCGTLIARKITKKLL